MPEALLGFDAREVGRLVEVLWTPERRRTYTLCDVKLPLSVDTLAWPTIFTGTKHVESRQRWNDTGWVTRPQWIGANNIWDDLAAMEACIVEGTPASMHQEFWKIAITWHVEKKFEQKSAGPYIEPTSPASVGSSWVRLGYDVADPSISGLCNCRYNESDADLRRQWGPRLNEHHLLRTLEDAHEFRELTDRRVPEHTPFFVLGLWQIP